MKSFVKIFLLIICIFNLILTGVYFVDKGMDNRKIKEQQIIMIKQKEDGKQENEKEIVLPMIGSAEVLNNINFNMEILMELSEATILQEYQSLYEENMDLIGWLMVPDTNINYPVMQTPGNEDYYLSYGFDKKENINGCLILDTDSIAGIGIIENNYTEIGGMVPSTNLIIHGHTMKSGMMFGGLKKYEEESYGIAHSFICFDSLYEKQEYELISAFYSQVYRKSEDVFKYYYFFQADTEDEFNDWYENIKNLSLYDTGVNAEYGDTFITLSCCSYQVENGRFVVVGKRIK